MPGAFTLSQKKSDQTPKTLPQEKACLCCGQIKPIGQFFTNKEWTQQLNHDGWCKECFADCKTKEDIKKYFYHNHRMWDQSIWQISCKKAGRQLEKESISYTKAAQGQKAQMRESLAPKFVPSVMQLKYYYFDPQKDTQSETSYGKQMQQQSQEKQAALERKKQRDIKKAQQEKVFSEQFNGYFTQQDLKYLENYYSKLNEDFSFEDENTRDYAKKVCKASLQLDKAQSDYALGRCSLSDVNDAMRLFDTLSKSGNFAACRRKQKQNAGVTGWAETTYYLETHGYLKTMDEEWEQDWVDKTISEYRRSIENLRLDLM